MRGALDMAPSLSAYADKHSHVLCVAACAPTGPRRHHGGAPCRGWKDTVQLVSHYSSWVIAKAFPSGSRNANMGGTPAHHRISSVSTPGYTVTLQRAGQPTHGQARESSSQSDPRVANDTHLNDHADEDRGARPEQSRRGLTLPC